MWPASFNLLDVFLAALATGYAIKIMDDCVDREFDLAIGQSNLATRYGSGVIGYGMLSLLIASYIEPTITVSLFASAYAVGMGFSVSQQYPSRLTGLGEGVLVLVLSLLVAGFRLTGASLCLMLGVQLIDDWQDKHTAALNPLKALGLLGAALISAPHHSIVVLFAYALFSALERWWRQRI